MLISEVVVGIYLVFSFFEWCGCTITESSNRESLNMNYFEDFVYREVRIKRFRKCLKILSIS